MIDAKVSSSGKKAKILCLTLVRFLGTFLILEDTLQR